MALAYNEEQRSLKDTAKDFAQSQSPIESFRKLRDEKNSTGYDQAIWQQMVELGWSGMIFPEAYGGFDFGTMGLAGCMEEFGRTLVASPLLSSVVLSGSTILFAGNEAQKQNLLPSIISGDLKIALAVDEQARHNPSYIKTHAQESDDGFVISGEKTMVIDGHVAEKLIVAARTSGDDNNTKGISLFIIDADTQGISRERYHLVDHRGYAKITLNNVQVSQNALLGVINEGFAPLDQALDQGRICLAAEMFGGILECFDRTVEYLKERKQFGHLIGSFQALQHRCSFIYTEIEIAKSVLMKALDALDTDAFPAEASAAKAKISELFEHVTNEATQLHGGMGVTDELDIGLFLKRSRVASQLLGDSRFHYDRYASLNGY